MKHHIPVTRRFGLSLNQPAPGDNRSHEARLRSALENELGEALSMPLSLCRSLSTVPPSSGYSVNGIVSRGPCDASIG